VVRTRRIADRDRIFFLTTTLQRGVAFLSARERTVILNVLRDLRTRGDFCIYAYVVMPNHLHLLLWPDKLPLIRIMRDLKSRTGYAIAQSRKTSGSIWQPRYFDNIIRRVKYFWEKLDYIHENPVTAGLAKHPQDWEWSSHRFYAKSGAVPILPDPIELPADGNALLWPAPWA